MIYKERSILDKFDRSKIKVLISFLYTNCTNFLALTIPYISNRTYLSSTYKMFCLLTTCKFGREEAYARKSKLKKQLWILNIIVSLFIIRIIVRFVTHAQRFMTRFIKG